MVPADVPNDSSCEITVIETILDWAHDILRSRKCSMHTNLVLEAWFWPNIGLVGWWGSGKIILFYSLLQLVESLDSRSLEVGLDCFIQQPLASHSSVLCF